jgi:hypothetical protein
LNHRPTKAVRQLRETGRLATAEQMKMAHLR